MSDPWGTGTYALWSRSFVDMTSEQRRKQARVVEDLGFRALWIPGEMRTGSEVLDICDELLAATDELGVATGILNLWLSDSDQVAAWAQVARTKYPGRHRLGIGAGHEPAVKATGIGWRSPMEMMGHYLDSLTGGSAPVPPGELILGALGPRMLALSRERAGGAHPYLVSAELTRRAREILGRDAFLAPEVKVVLDADADRSRDVARSALRASLTLPNYRRSLKRLGFGEEDWQAGASDRLVDEVVVWGDDEAIRRKIQGYFDAGADQVCVHLVGTDGIDPGPGAWKAIAEILALP